MTLFGFQSGSNHFNDKPLITADTNPASPFRDRVYVAWDAAVGGNTVDGGIHSATRYWIASERRLLFLRIFLAEAVG
jgi:hypothetical protein